MKDVLQDLSNRNSRLPTPEQLLDVERRRAIGEISFHAMALGRFDEAVAVSARLCSLLLQQGRGAEALQVAQGIIALCPPQSAGRREAVVSMSEILMRSQPDRSLALLDDELAATPDDQWLRDRRGMVLIDLERYEEAREVFDAALQEAVNSGDRLLQAYALDELGLIARHTGDLEKAKRLHESALALLLDGPHAMDTCVCYISLARVEQGREEFESAARYAKSAYELARGCGLHRMAAEAASLAVQALQRTDEPDRALGLASDVTSATDWPVGDPDVAHSLAHIRAYLARTFLGGTRTLANLRVVATEARSAAELFRVAGDLAASSEWAAYGDNLAIAIESYQEGRAET